MDFISKSLLSFLVLAFLVCSDVATSAATTNMTTVTSTAAAVTVVTKLAGSSPPTVVTKPATKAPVSCITGTCVGEEQCTNSTVIAAYTKGICKTGVCVTEEISSSSTYTFKCSNKGCAADKTAAPKGTKVICCEKADCNTYESIQNSAGKVYGISTAILMALVLVMSM